MILIVGHGPSSLDVDPDWIDGQFVVRLSTGSYKNLPGEYTPHVGTRVDVICATRHYREVQGIEFWHISGKMSELCRNIYRPFKPTKKPSTGLCAAIIARHKYPDDEICVIGFDYTMHPETLDRKWLHDVWAENLCIKSLGVTEHG